MVDTTDKTGWVTVTNYWPASGGADGEALDEAQARTRKSLRTTFRAVTSADYEALACATPGLRVARATAIPLQAPKVAAMAELENAQASVTVIVVPYSSSPRPTPSAGFRQTVHRHLAGHRLITTQVHVIGPYYVSVGIRASVYLQPRASVSSTRQRIEEALKEFLSPLKGGPAGKGWPFGRTVYQSEIYQTVENVDGVDHVEGVELRQGSSGAPNGDIIIPLHSLVYLDVDDLSLQIVPAPPTRAATGGSA